MNKRIKVVLVIAGGALVWSALVAEISLRYAKESFLTLFVLTTLAVVSTSYLTYRVTVRNKLDKQGPSKTTNRSQQHRQSRAGHSGRAREPQKGSAKVAPTSDRASTKIKPDSQPPASQSVGASGERINARVRVYYPRRSFGFIENEAGQAIFFHKSGVDAGIDDRVLTKKPNVSYVLGSSDRGPIATQIQIEQ